MAMTDGSETISKPVGYGVEAGEQLARGCPAVERMGDDTQQIAEHLSCARLGHDVDHDVVQVDLRFPAGSGPAAPAPGAGKKVSGTRKRANVGSGEQTYATRAYQQPDDDQKDPEEQGPTHDRDDATDYEDRGDDEQKHGHGSLP
jgi:hypothetical protein